MTGDCVGSEAAFKDYIFLNTGIILFEISNQTLRQMADNKSKTRPQDSSRINIHETYEVQYWTEALGISKEELTKVVQEVGTSAEAVRQALKK